MGRPRAFDVTEALDAALCVFWRKGFEATSYTDLTQAIGMERPALYSAFGNKEALFLKALDRYYERYLGYIPVALALPTSRDVAEHLLRNAVELNTCYPDRKGCLGIHGALAGSDDSESIRRALIDARAEEETSLRQRFEQDQKDGDLPKTANPAALAAFVLAVMHGMAVQAKAGFSREVLDTVVDQVLSTWPSNVQPNSQPANSRAKSIKARSGAGGSLRPG